MKLTIHQPPSRWSRAASGLVLALALLAGSLPSPAQPAQPVPDPANPPVVEPVEDPAVEPPPVVEPVPADQTNTVPATTPGQPGQQLPLPPGARTRPIPTRVRGAADRPALPPAGTPVVGAPAPGPDAAAPGAGAATATPPGPEIATVGDQEVIPSLKLENMALEQALDIYAGLVGRTLLRPPQLAGGPISLKAQSELTKQEAIEAFNAVFALNNISVIPVGQKFMKVVVAPQAIQEGARPTDIPAGDLSELGQYVTKVIKVSKVKPGDIAQAVQQFASGKIQNGVLVFDDQNFFVLRDFAVNVKRMGEIIEMLDVVPEQDYKLEVIPIRYGKVEEIYNTISSIISGQPGSFQSTRTTGATRTGATTGARGGAGGLGQQLNPQTGQPYQPATGARTTGLTTPGGARSSFADRLRQASAGATGASLTDARIIPDERSNSLIVYANKEDYKMITNIVARVDSFLPQVLIESIILEVSLNKLRNVGVSMIQQRQSFGNWTTAGASINPRAGPADNFLNVLTNLSTLGRGFSYFGQLGNEFDFTVTAIAENDDVKVLSRPRIQTTHAQPATFEIGDTVPYITSTGIGVGVTGTYSSYQEKRVTTRLDVTPYITPDGLVTMEVSQVIDQLGEPVDIDGNPVPTINTRSASAVVSIKDRDVVILGGFISDSKSASKSGIPFLMDIPGLGFFFRSRQDSGDRIELIILIRPTVLPTPIDAARMAEAERRSLPYAADAARMFREQNTRTADRLDIGKVPMTSQEAIPTASPDGRTPHEQFPEWIYR